MNNNFGSCERPPPSASQVSFFDQKLAYGWNMRELGDLLRTKKVPDIPGARGMGSPPMDRGGICFCIRVCRSSANPPWSVAASHLSPRRRRHNAHDLLWHVAVVLRLAQGRRGPPIDQLLALGVSWGGIFTFRGVVFLLPQIEGAPRGSPCLDLYSSRQLPLAGLPRCGTACRRRTRPSLREWHRCEAHDGGGSIGGESEAISRALRRRACSLGNMTPATPSFATRTSCSRRRC